MFTHCVHRLAAPVKITVRGLVSVLAKLPKNCTGRCKCGTKKQPCKNRVLPQLPQQPSPGEQLSQVEVRGLVAFMLDVQILNQYGYIAVAGLCERLG